LREPTLPLQRRIPAGQAHGPGLNLISQEKMESRLDKTLIRLSLTSFPVNSSRKLAFFRTYLSIMSYERFSETSRNTGQQKF
jgi:hypothetical protein